MILLVFKIILRGYHHIKKMLYFHFIVINYTVYFKTLVSLYIKFNFTNT